MRFPQESPQVTDVAIPRVPKMRTYPQAHLSLRCGLGPKLRVDGVTVRTRAGGTFGDLLAGRALRFSACRAVRLRAGANTLDPVPFDTYRIDSAVVDPAGGVAAVPPARPSYVQVSRWTPQDRRVEVNADQDSYLTVNENLNPGWRATIGGRTLRPVRVDGWKQAWVVPAGTAGTVDLTYAPDRVYRASLFAGLGLLPLLLVVGVWPLRLTPLRSRVRGGPVAVARRRGRVAAIAGEVAAILVSAGMGYWTGGFSGTARRGGRGGGVRVGAATGACLAAVAVDGRRGAVRGDRHRRGGPPRARPASGGVRRDPSAAYSAWSSWLAWPSR